MKMTGKRLIMMVTVGALLVLLVTAGFTVAFNNHGKGGAVVNDNSIEDGNGEGPPVDPGNKTDDDEDDDDANETDDDEDKGPPVDPGNKTDDEDDDDANETDDDEDEGPPVDPGNKTDDDEKEDDEDDEEREREGSIGHFTNGTDGRFVSFDLTDSLIKNYTVNRGNDTIMCFNEVMLEGFDIDDQESKGSYFEIEGDDTEIRIYDVSPGLMKIDIERGEWSNVSFNLGNFQVDGQDGPNLNLKYGNYSAKILSVSRGPPSNVPPHEPPKGKPNETGKPPVNVTPPGPDKASIEVYVNDGYVNYSFVGDVFFFFRMTDGEDEKEREMEENISKGISSGEVGGEVVVDKEDSDYKDISVTYADMNMMTQVEGENKVRVMVSSDTLGEDGKIVVAEISKKIMNVTDFKELTVKFDGEDIEMADSYEDLKDPSDGAEYMVTIGQDKVQVLVMVPHFSTHTIDIMKTLSDPVDLLGNVNYYLPAVLITAIIIASTAWITKTNKDK